MTATHADVSSTDSPVRPLLDPSYLGTATQAIHAVGVVEILAGLVVAMRPRFGAGWSPPGGIVVNQLTLSGDYDVALRDFGLLCAAVALARLAKAQA